MKIWQLTFLDSAYLKYKSKLKLPLLPKNALMSVFQGSFSESRPDYSIIKPGNQSVIAAVFINMSSNLVIKNL